MIYGGNEAGVLQTRASADALGCHLKPCKRFQIRLQGCLYHGIPHDDNLSIIWMGFLSRSCHGWLLLSAHGQKKRAAIFVENNCSRWMYLVV